MNTPAVIDIVSFIGAFTLNSWLSTLVCVVESTNKSVVPHDPKGAPVGENFVYEARSIHYNNKKRDKGIYGTASKDDIKELREEGIDTNLIPWVENENN